MSKNRIEIEIEIDYAYEGCRWLWDIWIDGEFYKNGAEDTVKDAMDAVLKWLEDDIDE